MSQTDKFNLQEVEKRLEKMKAELPIIIANQAQKFFLDSFKNEGFTDSAYRRWKPRQAPRKVKAKDITRNILVKSGRLRRSIQTKEVSFDRIIISSDVPYAAAHNDGLNAIQAVRPHKRSSRKRVKDTIYGSPRFINGKFKRGKGRNISLAGGTYNVRGFSRPMKIPQRQFIGNSEVLEKMQVEKIEKVIDAIWR